MISVSGVFHRSIALLFFLTACHSASQLGVSDATVDRRVDAPDPVEVRCGIVPAEAWDRFDEGWPSVCDDATGAGIFGRWIADARGEPAFDYTFDPTRDRAADLFQGSGSPDDHWFFFGNDAIGASAHADGYVEFFDESRGAKILNRWEPQRRRFAGGFKLVRFGGRGFSTLYSDLPSGATQRRVFGEDYKEATTTVGELVVRETVTAPPGLDPVLVSIAEFSNTGAKPVEIEWIEYWDANPLQLTPALITTFGLADAAWERRHRANRRYVAHFFRDESLGFIGMQPVPAPGVMPEPVDRPARTDDHWRAIALIALDDAENADLATDEHEVFPGPAKRPVWPPESAWIAPDPEGRGLEGDGNVLAARRKTSLAPGETRTFRHLFGYIDASEVEALRERYRDFSPTVLEPLFEWATPDGDRLRREGRWHARALAAGSYWSDYFETRLVDQGSAYLYLQGLSGAHRDFVLAALPLIYTRPDLAKDTLRFSMRAQEAESGKLPYAHVNVAQSTGALIHFESSDLDLFLLWALADYLGATQDAAFLDETLPFYPKHAGVSGTVLDHARAAFAHLRDDVGLGPHGLIRSGTGDWNDVLNAFSPNILATIARGESTLNAGLAAFALPRLADAIEEADGAFADELRAFAASQAEALEAMWAGSWLSRGYLGIGEATLGGDSLFLDTQSFPVLAGLWDEDRLVRLFGSIRRMSVEPQSVGALSLSPPGEGPLLDPGSDTNGGTWASIDGLLTWAWAKHDPAEAWEFFLSTTMAARAEAYPDIWYGIWSGPDSYNADTHDRPGETFHSTFTPMTDFPVMNMNRHAGPLHAALRLCGFDTRAGRIVIDPLLPFSDFAVRTTLMGAAYRGHGHKGYYRPVADGTFAFAVRPPKGLAVSSASLTVDGAAHEFTATNGLIEFTVVGGAGEIIRWEISTAP